MGHPGDVRDHGLPAEVLADGKRQTALGSPELLGLKDIPKRDHGGVFIGHFNSDGGFSRDRRLNTDIHCSKTELDIIGKIYDLADLDTLLGLQFISCDGWPLAYICDRHIDAEGPEGFLKPEGSLLELSVCLSVVSRLSFLKKFEGRETVLAVFLTSGLPACSRSSGSAVFLITAVSVDFDSLQVLVGDSFPGLRFICFLSCCNCCSDRCRRGCLVFPGRKRRLLRPSFLKTCFLRFYCGHLLLGERIRSPGKFLSFIRNGIVPFSLRLGIKSRHAARIRNVSGICEIEPFRSALFGVDLHHSSVIFFLIKGKMKRIIDLIRILGPCKDRHRGRSGTSAKTDAVRVIDPDQVFRFHSHRIGIRPQYTAVGALLRIADRRSTDTDLLCSVRPAVVPVEQTYSV